MSEENEDGRTAKEKLGLTDRATWQFSLDDVQAGLAHCKPDARDTMIAAFRWCNDPEHSLSRDSFSAQVGYDANTVYKVFTGKHVSPETGRKYDVPEKLLKATQLFLEREQLAFQEGERDFVKTPTATRIFTACDLARESNSVAILSGPSHVGKTWALRHYQQSNNHGRTIMVELDAASGLGGMVRRIATACVISSNANTADLIGRIQNALSPTTLLIIDECHLLQHTYRRGSFFSCIEVIRRIHDFSKCGMVLSWTILDNLKAASQGELQQVWRRGVHKTVLSPMPTKGDLTAILKHRGLEFPMRDKKVELTVQDSKGQPFTITEKPYDVLKQVAKRDGLKAVTERIRYGCKLAAKSRQPVGWKHFIDAHLRIEKQADPQNDWDDDDKKDGGAK